MKIVKGLAVAGLVALVAPAALAQDGWYVGAEMGAVFPRDANTRGGLDAGTWDYDPGLALLGQIGGYLPFNLRVEGELGWRRNTLDTIAGTSAAGTMNVLSAMANLYYDIPTGTAFTPYLGVGLGGVHAIVDSPSIGDSDLAWAYQGIAGLAYHINDNLSLKTNYRYFASQDLGFWDDGGARVNTQYRTHNVMVGFTWRFGVEPRREVAAPVIDAPPPAPAPVPAPAPAAVPTNFIVFFDWDRSELTPEARAVLRQAAAAIQQGQATRVSLVGHADRSGPDSYNLRLSERRAQNVRAYLTELGVAPGAMAVSARGEADPLVPTPDGVREPQNRRVEIVLP